MTPFVNTVPKPSPYLAVRYAHQACQVLGNFVFEVINDIGQLVLLKGSAVRWSVQNHTHMQKPDLSGFCLFSPSLPEKFEEKSDINGFEELINAYCTAEKTDSLAEARARLNRGIQSGLCYGKAVLIFKLLEDNPQLSLDQCVSLCSANKKILPYLEALETIRYTFAKSKNQDGLDLLHTIAPHDINNEFIPQGSAEKGALKAKLEARIEEGEDQLIFFSAGNQKSGHIYVLRVDDQTGRYSFYNSQLGCYSYESKETLLTAFDTHMRACSSHYQPDSCWQIEHFSL